MKQTSNLGRIAGALALAGAVSAGPAWASHVTSLEEARKLASEKNIPVLLEFGSKH